MSLVIWFYRKDKPVLIAQFSQRNTRKEIRNLLRRFGSVYLETTKTSTAFQESLIQCPVVYRLYQVRMKGRYDSEALISTLDYPIRTLQIESPNRATNGFLTLFSLTNLVRVSSEAI